MLVRLSLPEDRLGKKEVLMTMIQRKRGNGQVFVRTVILTDLAAHAKASKPVADPEKIRKFYSERILSLGSEKAYPLLLNAEYI